jgi:glycyl-tRNA synthetase alpha subunit
MDARGVISTTERAALMARVRTLSCRAAAAYLEQTREAAPPAPAKRELGGHEVRA